MFPQGLEILEKDVEYIGIWQHDHNSLCEKCGLIGELLLCDGCNVAYHLLFKPKIKDMPRGAWLCPECSEQLLMVLDKQDGKPKAIKYVKDLKNDSDYEEDSKKIVVIMKKPRKEKKKKRKRKNRRRRKEEEKKKKRLKKRFEQIESSDDGEEEEIDGKEVGVDVEEEEAADGEDVKPIGVDKKSTVLEKKEIDVKKKNVPLIPSKAASVSKKRGAVPCEKNDKEVYRSKHYKHSHQLHS